MEIIVSKSELYNKLKVLSKLIPQKSFLPAYSSFLFEINGNILKVTAGDEDGRISTELEITNAQTLEQSVLLDAKMLLNGLTFIPEQPINISFVTNEKYINVQVKYSNGKFDMVGGVGEDYPIFNAKGEGDPLLVNANDFFYGIKHTQLCCANDDLRPVLAGVFFKIEDEQFVCVGTDGMLLSKAVCKTDKQNSSVSFILPSKYAKTASSLSSFVDDQVMIINSDNNVSFNLGCYHLTCLKVEGNYPKYDSVIPQNNLIKAECNTQDLLAAVKRVSCFSDVNLFLIKMSFTKEMVVISADDVDFSRSSEESVLLSDYNGDNFEIAFNSQKLITILSSISDEEVTMTFNKPSTASVFYGRESGSSLLYLIMPLSINR
jgi:DNA polymerase III subunit beta